MPPKHQPGKLSDEKTWVYFGEGPLQHEVPLIDFDFSLENSASKDVLSCETPLDVWEMCMHPIVECGLSDSSKEWNRFSPLNPFLGFSMFFVF